MEWIEIILKNLPTIILLVLAGFFLGAEIIKAGKVWKEKKDNTIQEAVNKQNAAAADKAELQDIHNRLNEIASLLSSIQTKQTEMEDKIAILTESDMNDIKAWIVAQHHHFVIQQGWIDAFSRDVVEKRYADYCREHGNSYIKDLVARIRDLPMDPVNKDKK